MDLFTYLMAKNGNNSSVHGDLFSYLLGKGQSQTQTISGVTIYIPNAKKLVSFMMTKESTQDGEPTPDNPIEVKTVKGYRNLFDKDNANIVSLFISVNNNYLNQDASNRKSIYIDCSPNTKYVITKKAGYIFRVASSNTLPERNATITAYFRSNDTASIAKITTDSNAKYLIVTYYYPGNDTSTEQEILNSIQIVEGDQELPYVPYGNNYVNVAVNDGTNTNNYPIPLNNNEIVGIGDYKDELIVDKSGHVWLNKLIGKVVYNGTENWLTSQYQLGLFYNYDVSNKYLVQNALSNYYKNVINTNITDNGTANANLNTGEFSFRMGTKDRIYIKNTAFTSTNDFKNWLSTHNTEVYYVLATPETIDLQTTVDISLFKGVNNISNSEDGYMTIEYK